MELYLNKNWYILQDVHDAGEQLELFKEEDFLTEQGPQMSEWEAIPELKHLQLLLSDHPYWGRQLRYFNDAPWWYKNEFTIMDDDADHFVLTFTNVDYYCKVWLNGIYLGQHEGYSIPFSFDLDEAVNRKGNNRLIVKVWSPWDKDVDQNNQKRRTFDVYRNMVKGTYEHSDTFVQRDVNPVGIYGKVSICSYKEACFIRKPEFSYTLSDDLKKAYLNFKADVTRYHNKQCRLHVICLDNLTKEIQFEAACNVPEKGLCELSGEIDNFSLWSTWDQGTPYTYKIKMWLESEKYHCLDMYEEITGFRKVEMIRNEKQTMFILNNNNFYIRGTAYFPDNYISAMTRERYQRDLLAMKACGFNMVRVHVHVDLPDFYELCTEIGLGIMHDSEYNWAHPLTDEFAKRFISIYLETVDMLKKYPAVLCWICMNEPGLLDTKEGGSRSHSRSMDINPGPALYEAVCRHDSTRPVIKGSFCEDDFLSGDSHNYMGSLYGEEGHYSDIYGTVEKLNTEYGFDALPCFENLKKEPQIYSRLKKIENQYEKIGNYQYSLLKYYTEHYRMQKYNPNAGYVQFLFSDIAPTSFYGLYDWWGVPKKGLEAMLESNMPIGVFLKYRERLDEIYVVNDLPEGIGTCDIFWHVINEKRETLEKGSCEAEIGKDSIVLIKTFGKRFGDTISVYLTVKKNQKVVCSNHYEDLYHMPEHVSGHPGRMSHEFGIRLYQA